MQRAHNFNAGPAILPVEVVENTSKAILDFNNSGMGIMEISHRGKDFDAVIKQAQADCLTLMNLDAKDYEVLFLQGGASTQFAMLPMNFLHTKAEYVNTGVWATKAYKEAKFIAGDTKKVSEIASSADKNFNYIPQNITYGQDADYVHITTNNTIYGTEWRHLPDVGVAPLVVDMSSDLFAQAYNFSKCNLIYAGAQKNIGPSGVTLVVIKRSWLEEKANNNLPTMLRYSTHSKEESLFNTPPTLPIYVVGQTFKWILKHGLDKIEQNNIQKAKLVYEILDAYPDFYKAAVPAAEDRSLMNITFNLQSAELEDKFISDAKMRNMIGLKGHRLVGGIRVSAYNACPIESLEFLAKFMIEFMNANK